VVAFFGFLKQVEIVVKHFLFREGNAVQTGQLLALFVTSPISAGHADDLEGFDNANDVEKFRKCKIFVDRENAVRLEKDEYFIADLLGIDVVDENGDSVGELSDVIETGANDVYVVNGANGEEILIPAIKDCILEVDVAGRIMKVHLLEYSKD
jgi:16S rRNA processing protein RimM